MAIDYRAISEKNRERYGTDVGRYGPALLAKLYADRTHFIFELLQNAEDALRRRDAPPSRAVVFEINERSLTVRHYGDPFNEADVWSICGLTESTKQDEKTAIGHFGIGFKSVYAWTDRPEIHSGGADFAIEDFVHPASAPKLGSAPDETVIVIPFKDDAIGAHGQIAEALSKDADDALRFLREIEEIEWRVDGELSGHYRCETRELDGGARLVTIGDASEATDPESWLVFSDPVYHGGESTGYVEIAFAHQPQTPDEPARIRPVHRSLLSAYFPTALETRLGFLVQGPYRTTPARDNVLSDDEWNQALVAQTAALLKPTLVWLREHDYLTTDALACMPIDERQFTRPSTSIVFPREPTRFYPLFQAVKDALRRNALLPAFSGGHVRPEWGLLGGTEALRKLFSVDQLKALFGLTGDVAWLDPEITVNRARTLHDYLRSTLCVREIDTGQVIRRLDEAFLEQQRDEWIRALYEFLDDQRAFRKEDWFAEFADLPLMRLKDGTHVASGADDSPRAYLPASTSTDFPTVRRTVCDSKDSLGFLKSLGLREPDLVDDVKVNILPAYLADHVSVDDSRYESDLRRIVDTYKTVDGDRRRKLVEVLRQAKFVRVIDIGSGEPTFAKPNGTYAPTDALRGLFDGLKGVLFVDEAVAALQGDDAKKLLTACGVRDHIRVLNSEKDVDPSDDRWVAVRERAGWPKSNRGNKVRDRRLDRLNDLLKLLPSANAGRREVFARLLWDELLRIAARDHNQFFGRYTWFYHSERSQSIDARFVKQLNKAAWIPAGDGTLLRPRDVTIESLGWPRDSFVEERIRFRAPADQQTVEQLAEKVGVSIEAVKLAEEIEASGMTPKDLRRLLKGHSGSETQQASVEGVDMPTSAQRSGHGRSSRETFRSYLEVQRDPQPEVDGEKQAQRMAREDKALRYIRKIEPEWEQTEQGNPGFDLYQTDADGEIVRWCEVKSLSGAWGDRPVTMSHTQFEWAQEKGDAYWLYVVEHADDPDQIRILRIQDPAGQAETFTFDQGWAEVAE